MRASSMVQAWLEEGRKDAFALQQIVRNMCNTGMTQAQVAQATGLSVQEVKALLG